MVTFEEFFTKKKIDVSLLQADNRPLYDDFRLHYALMGEKSFDHTKKFWFNKLRRQYPLPKAAPEQAERADTQGQADRQRTNTVAAPLQKEETSEHTSGGPTSATRQNVLSDSQNKPTGFKPRFKSGVTNSAEPQSPAEQKSDAATQQDNPVSKPAGFKPRFKPGVTKTAEPQPDAEQKSDADTHGNGPPASKPAGSTARMNSGGTQTAEPQPADAHKYAPHA